ncbi:MAG: OmpL47-type beta-barrel domain-containing protein [Candidatus Hodarchaeales archaeon]|jgi:hypothetical protein
MKRTVLVIGIIFLLIGASVVSSMDNIAKDNSIDYSSLELVSRSEQEISSNSTWYMYSIQDSSFYASYPNGTYKFRKWGGDSFFSGGTWTNDGKYLCCLYENGTLYDVDPETLEPSSIGDGGVSLNGLSYNPVTCKLYGASGKDLYEIDMTTGEQTHIGTFGIDENNHMIAIAFDIDGICYGWDVKFSGNAILYNIDLETGEATEYCDMGQNLLYAQDGAFKYDTAKLFLVAYSSGAFLAYWDWDAEELVIVSSLPWAATALAITYEGDDEPPVTTHSLDPSEPDGLNGWYVSDVNVTLTATDDISGVKEIKYRIWSGATQTIIGDNGTFILTQADDGDDVPVEYWAIDNAGNEETPHHEFTIDMDQTKPNIDLIYYVDGDWKESWDLLFTATAWDATSGMERVEFYINDELKETVYGSGPEYQWTFPYLIFTGNIRIRGLIYNPKITEEHVKFFSFLIIIIPYYDGGNYSIDPSAYAYDKAGNWDYDIIEEPKTIEPGFNLFRSVTLPNNYTGYIGRFLINAEFYIL